MGFQRLNMQGRPPIWDDPDAFDKAVDEYFSNNGCPTWTGLALHLGFESRQSLQDYKEKPGFSYSIKKALLRIESTYEDRAIYSKQPTGAIFALKNFGWKDLSEIDHTTGGKSFTLNIKPDSEE